MMQQAYPAESHEAERRSRNHWFPRRGRVGRRTSCSIRCQEIWKGIWWRKRDVGTGPITRHHSRRTTRSKTEMVRDTACWVFCSWVRYTTKQSLSARKAGRWVPNCASRCSMTNGPSTWDCQKVISDRGLHNRGGFAQGLVARGVQFRTIEVESPEQLWRTEGHGAILKGIIQRFWEACVRRIHRAGWEASPRCSEYLENPHGKLQVWQVMTWILEHSRLMPRMRAMSLGNRCQSANLRGEPFIEEDLSERVVRALLRKASPILKDSSVRDLVCFKTDQVRIDVSRPHHRFRRTKASMGYPSRDASLRSIGSSETSQRGRSLDMPGRGTGFIDATEPATQSNHRRRGRTSSRTWRHVRRWYAATWGQAIVPKTSKGSNRCDSRWARYGSSISIKEETQTRTGERPSRCSYVTSQKFFITRTSGARACGGFRTFRITGEQRALREMFQKSGTTGPGVEPAEDVWNRTHFAGGWQVHEETGVVVRIHDTPTALLNPESTGDCPIPKERLSGVRVTSLTGKDGSTQTIQDSWEDGQDKEFQNRIDREDCVHSDWEDHRT